MVLGSLAMPQSDAKQETPALRAVTQNAGVYAVAVLIKVKDFKWDSFNSCQRDLFR